MPRNSNGHKREAILDAAVVEIARQGYYQTTVAMIARRRLIDRRRKQERRPVLVTMPEGLEPSHDEHEKIDQRIKKPLSLLDKYNYIAIEGNIGSGKTSLAKKMGDDFNAKLVLERFADNPFLPKFYEDEERYAFPLEMSFLADRYHQLSDDLGQFDLFKNFEDRGEQFKECVREL